MKVGDLIRVKKMEWMDDHGYLLHVISEEKHGGYGIIVISGRHIGLEHIIYPTLDKREFEVVA